MRDLIDKCSDVPVRISIANLCRLDVALANAIATNQQLGRIGTQVALVTAACGAVYGFSFGVWRAPTQGLYSAVKLPLLLFAIVACTTLANGIVARVLRATISIRQGMLVVLLSLAVASVLLAAVSPVLLMLALTLPSPLGLSPAELALQLSQGDPLALNRTAQWLLLAHIATVGAAGLVGNFRLYELLCRLTSNRRIALQVLVAWLAVDAFVGTQLSWILRPFVCKPGLPAALIRPDALDGNFFEELWRILGPLLH
jgi:hypothetical protein